MPLDDQDWARLIDGVRRVPLSRYRDELTPRRVEQLTAVLAQPGETDIRRRLAHVLNDLLQGQPDPAALISPLAAQRLVQALTVYGTYGPDLLTLPDWVAAEAELHGNVLTCLYRVRDAAAEPLRQLLAGPALPVVAGRRPNDRPVLAAKLSALRALWRLRPANGDLLLELAARTDEPLPVRLAALRTAIVDAERAPTPALVASLAGSGSVPPDLRTWPEAAGAALAPPLIELIADAEPLLAQAAAGWLVALGPAQAELVARAYVDCRLARVAALYEAVLARLDRHRLRAARAQRDALGRWLSYPRQAVPAVGESAVSAAVPTEADSAEDALWARAAAGRRLSRRQLAALAESASPARLGQLAAALADHELPHPRAMVAQALRALVPPQGHLPGWADEATVGALLRAWAREYDDRQPTYHSFRVNQADAIVVVREAVSVALSSNGPPSDGWLRQVLHGDVPATWGLDADQLGRLAGLALDLLGDDLSARDARALLRCATNPRASDNIRALAALRLVELTGTTRLRALLDAWTEPQHPSYYFSVYAWPAEARGAALADLIRRLQHADPATAGTIWRLIDSFGPGPAPPLVDLIITTPDPEVLEHATTLLVAWDPDALAPALATRQTQSRALTLAPKPTGDPAHGLSAAEEP